MMKKTSYSLLCGLLMLLAWPMQAQYFETTLTPWQDCFVTTPPSTVVANSTTNPMPISEVSGGSSRAFMKFDLSAIPREAIVTAATFTYNISSAPATSSLQMQVAVDTWDQTTETWSGQSYGNDTYLTDVPASLTINGNTGTYVVDVTGMVKYMVNRQMLNGWRFIKTTTTGTVNMSSKEAAVALRPQLKIRYLLPPKVAASIVPATGASAADGSVDITVTEGSGNYSYAWYRNYSAATVFSTSQNVSGLLPGAYKLLVTDNISLKTISQFVLVGNVLGATTVTMQPDALFGHDANTITDIGVNGNPPQPPYTNYGAQAIMRSGRISILTYYRPSFLKFAYLGAEEASNIQVESATLNLTGATHSGAVTSFKLNRVITPWYENTLTETNRVVDAATMEQVFDPGPTNTNPNMSINVSDIAIYHSQHPLENFGYSLGWFTSGTSANNNYFNFHSSDAVVADSSKRPALVLTFRTKQDYAELSDAPDARTYPVNSLLKFIHRERYQDVSPGLTYSIYRVSNNQLVLSQATYPLTPVKYGDNRFAINLRAVAGGLSPDVYMLEVTNEKKEKTYLRFKLN